MAGNGSSSIFRRRGEWSALRRLDRPDRPRHGRRREDPRQPAGEIAHAVIIPPRLFPHPPRRQRASAAGVSPFPAAPKIAAEDGAFRLSSSQRASLERHGQDRHQHRRLNSPMFSQIEVFVTCDRFDRAIAEGGKAIDKAFDHAAEMIRVQTRAQSTAHAPTAAKPLPINAARA